MEAAEVRVGKFKVVRRLGRGGMGAVYEGYDPALDRRVAIKTLTTDAISDEESRGRFEREARAAAKLQHPNIVTVYELGNFGRKEKPYIVMEYLEGSDLASAIQEGKTLSLAEALDVAVQVCRALDFAHQHGVVHRDVKPSNVRYLDDGRVKIMDFGIARIEGGDQITRSGVMVGTPHYMSPEQIKGEPVDRRSDVFSSGCILYEMLAGGRPFQGDSTTAILYKIINEQPVPLLAANPELPQEIQNILDKALAKSPEDRYESAGAMAQELEKLLHVYRKSFPRLSAALNNRVERLERLFRQEQWADVAALAKEIVSERPDLEFPQRALRKALRELSRRQLEGKMTSEDKTRHLAEISQEFAMLYGPSSQPTEIDDPAVSGAAVDLTPGDLKLRTRTGTAGGRTTGASWGKALLLAAGILTVAAVAGWYFLPGVVGPKDVSHPIRISSDPPGARVLVNGVERGVTAGPEKPLEILLDGKEGDGLSIELSREGYRPASSRVTLGSEPPPPIAFTLEPLPLQARVVTRPPGASVRVDGEALSGMTPLALEMDPSRPHELIVSKEDYVSRTVNLAVGEEPPSEIVLAPVTKPGTLVVVSSYNLSVLSRGGATLAEGLTELAIPLAVGSHTITLYAPQVFLNRAFDVEVKEASTTRIEAPALAKVSVRASPGNCTLTINGVAAEAPPISGQEIVSGSNAFVFEWPGGRKDEQIQEVKPGGHAYVTGQVR